MATDAEKEAAKAAEAEAKAQADAEKAEAKAKADAEKEAAKAAKTSVTVRWPGGERTYTKAQHGENFVELAGEFASKSPDRVVA